MLNDKVGPLCRVLILLFLILILSSCTFMSWNIGNTNIEFIPAVATRIALCDAPVYLTDSEKKKLLDSLSGTVEDMFTEDDLESVVLAYYELTTKGVNQNHVEFRRFSKDKQRYVFLVYSKSGHLFGAGNARTDSRDFSSTWFKPVDCP
jgi:hypothetical protein